MFVCISNAFGVLVEFVCEYGKARVKNGGPVSEDLVLKNSLTRC